MHDENYISGTCSILIYSESLRPCEISDHLKLKPTKFIEKGKDKKINAQKNGWFYEIKFDKIDEFDFVLKKLVKLYLNNMGKFQGLKDCEIYIRCFIHSDLAQIGYEISSETIKLLKKINKTLEFSILSWGGVEMN